MSEDFEYLFKILILGDSGVGKSCTLLRFTEDDFSMNHVPTIGVDFKSRIISVQNKKVKLQIWDTAGQERFKTLAKTYYNGAMGVILAYDCSQPRTFDNIRSWLETIKLQASEHTAMVLIGNKYDLLDKQVTDNEASSFAADLGIKFFPTSARTGSGINQAFLALADEIYTRKLYEVIGNAGNKRLSNKSKKKRSCCK